MKAFENKKPKRKNFYDWYECREVWKYIIIQSVLWIAILGLALSVLLLYQFGKDTANFKQERRYYHERTQERSTME